MIYLDSLHAREALRIFDSSSFGSYHFRFSNNSILARLPYGDSFELSPTQFTALIRDLAFRAWNADWVFSSFGRFTFKFFDTIYCRVSKTWLRPRGPLARFLSGHSLCSDYLTRFHLSSPVFCSCVPPSGSLIHDLQQCSQFSFINSAFLGVDFSFLTDLTFYPQRGDAVRTAERYLIFGLLSVFLSFFFLLSFFVFFSFLFFFFSFPFSLLFFPFSPSFFCFLPFVDSTLFYNSYFFSATRLIFALYLARFASPLRLFPVYLRYFPPIFSFFFCPHPPFRLRQIVVLFKGEGFSLSLFFVAFP